MSRRNPPPPPPTGDSSDDDVEWKSSKGKGKGKGKSSVCKSFSIKKTSSSKAKNHNNNDPPSSDEDMDDDDGGGGGGGLAGNDQSVRENSKDFRRQVRSKYRDVLEDLQHNAKDYVEDDDQGGDNHHFNITDKLLLVDKLYNSVTQTREAAMDSSTIAQLAILGKQKAQALKTDMFTFKPADFAEKIVIYNGHQRGEVVPEDKWKALGELTRKYFKLSPSFTCVLGTFERSEYVGKEKVARQKNQDKEDFIKNKTKVKELDGVDGETNEETTAKMTEYVYNLLVRFYNEKPNEGEPIDFFDFTCDPSSFGKTVENIFYLSFLVREGLAKVFLDDDRLPVIEPIDRKKDKDGKTVKEAVNTRLFNQVAVSFDYNTWKEIIQVYGIEHAAINIKKK